MYLLEWKENRSDKYALLIKGARRIGKSTIAKEFAKNEFKSYILIDFAHTNKEIIELFNDMYNLDFFCNFINLQVFAYMKKNRLLFLMKFSFFQKLDKQSNILLLMKDINTLKQDHYYKLRRTLKIF